MARTEFKTVEVEDLLVRCHRRCCVCHRHCGVKIEVDHIVPLKDGGTSDIDNAIPLCFECHAEVHHYNTQHPKGRRFAPSELRHHRDQWLELCRERPEMFVAAQPSPEAGSLERLESELSFNLTLLEVHQPLHPPVAPNFEFAQFRRAVADGTFTWVSQNLRDTIHDAYARTATVSARGDRLGPPATGGPWSELKPVSGSSGLSAAYKAAVAAITEALRALEVEP